MSVDRKGLDVVDGAIAAVGAQDADAPQPAPGEQRIKAHAALLGDPSRLAFLDLPADLSADEALGVQEFVIQLFVQLKQLRAQQAQQLVVPPAGFRLPRPPA
jgi:hypothetical protein